MTPEWLLSRAIVRERDARILLVALVALAAQRRRPTAQRYILAICIPRRGQIAIAAVLEIDRLLFATRGQIIRLHHPSSNI